MQPVAKTLQHTQTHNTPKHTPAEQDPETMSTQVKQVRLCDVPGCDRKHKAKGMCQPHYDALRMPVYVAAHKDSVKAYQANYYIENRGQILDRASDYRATHTDEIAAYQAGYDRTDYRAEYNKTHKQESADYREATTERRKEVSREYAATPQGRQVQRRSKNRRRIRKLDNNSHLTPQQRKLSDQRYAELVGQPCYICHTPYDPETFEVDHVWPVSKKGTDEASNLESSCRTCNRSKGNRLLSEWKPNVYGPQDDRTPAYLLEHTQEG